MSEAFVHLHLHTEYSIVDGAVRIPALMEKCVQENMPAVAMTDRSNLFGLLKFYRCALKNGVKPIIGVDLNLMDPDDEDRPFRLVLLCQNVEAYRRLTRLVSRTYLEGQHRGVPMAMREWLTPDSCEGLIALSAGIHGDVGRALVADNEGLAARRVAAWVDLFGDRFYLEVSRTGRASEDAHAQRAVELASRSGVPIVATNDVRFIAAGDFVAHEARVCIQQGRQLSDTERPHDYTEQQYLRSPDEMSALFSDIPEALQNSVEIARRCNLSLTLGQSVLPAFPVPKGQIGRAHV
jgi:DNA polymerase-3 subunit alpha